MSELKVRAPRLVGDELIDGPGGLTLREWELLREQYSADLRSLRRKALSLRRALGHIDRAIKRLEDAAQGVGDGRR